jgi:hypothetical protein
VAQRNDGAQNQALLSPGLELDVLDGDFVDGEVEVMDSAFDGGAEAVGEDCRNRLSCAALTFALGSGLA